MYLQVKVAYFLSEILEIIAFAPEEIRGDHDGLVLVGVRELT